jgi:hypothetical protein
MIRVISKWEATGSPDEIYIGRGSKWGNPFTWKEGTKANRLVRDREEAIECYEQYIRYERADLMAAIDDGELDKKTLVCYCKPKACHGDVLAQLVKESYERRFRMELMPQQKKAITLLDHGRVLHGGTGSGKGLAALGYYVTKEVPHAILVGKEKAPDIYVVTTAKKRDNLDWQSEAATMGIFVEEEYSRFGKLTVVSWNEIVKLTDVEDAFFIFDEQRLVGHGAWVKAFLKIAKRNRWIMLSATPGDTWLDYAPLFIANGWYKNITDFKYQHVVYRPRSKFPVVQRYVNESKLERLRNEILVEMPFARHTNPIRNWMYVEYDKELYRKALVKRWHVYEDRPIKDAAELGRVLRRIVYSDPSRLEMVQTLLSTHDRLIVFYNYNYELEILRTLRGDIPVLEWNGHQKDKLPEPPDDSQWVYLVQYTAGAEGWNCITTNATLFYSMNRSYKIWHQSFGRTDRLNTPYKDQYYYILASDSPLDDRNRAALDEKRDFNMRDFVEDELGIVDTSYNYGLVSPPVSSKFDAPAQAVRTPESAKKG